MGAQSQPLPGSVLVADDDRINRTLLSRALRDDGHRVRTAADGREALAMLAEEPADVVLLDVVMPQLDGVSVLQRMKADEAVRDVPVIMISALDDLAHVVRCIELGAEDYLPKPFNPVLLRARISAGLNKRRLSELERTRVRDVFARFLPESVVDEVLARTKGGVRLGGVRLVGTALFTDLRAFTSFAEANPPDLVIEVLNRFLGGMTEAVLDHGGTIVDYMGDGLLALFGAPIEAEDHADRALAAAREMVSERLPRVNDWVASTHSGTRFRFGIGMNSGSMMSGHVGSERRLKYSAVGDTVNTASRIQGLTKELGRCLLFSQSTHELLTAASDLEFVGEVTVRGRRAATRLWTLRGI
jgi:adenylate cyclase